MMVFAMTAMVMVPMASYADEQQHPGMAYLDIEITKDGIIDSYIEIQTATLFSDVVLHSRDHDELMSTPEMAEFWEDIQIGLIAPGFGDFTNASFFIGLEEQERPHLESIKKQINRHYPDADYEIDIAYMEYPLATRDDLPLSDDMDSESMRGTVGKSLVKHTDILNKPIPDNTGKLVEMDEYLIPAPTTVTNIKVAVTIDHEDHDELNGYLKLSDGTLVKLFARERGIPDGKYTWAFTESDALSGLVGKELSGSIKLMIGDYRSRDVGKLVSWDVTIIGTQHTDHTGPPGFDVLTSWIPDFIKRWFNDTSCSSSTDNCIPQQAGMIYSVLRDGGPREGTIGLGGVETNDTKRGFLIPGHSLYHGVTGQSVFHDVVSEDNFENLLGQVVLNNAPDNNDGYADVAFVEYPLACQVIDDAGNTCIPHTGYLPTVDSMKIFINSVTSYTVTGVADDLQNSQQVCWKGIRSGEQCSTLRFSTPLTLGKGSDKIVILGIRQPYSQLGDSGSPVYVKDGNNNVRFVGMISGNVSKFGIVAVVPWAEIQEDLGLKHIS